MGVREYGDSAMNRIPKVFLHRRSVIVRARLRFGV